MPAENAIPPELVRYVIEPLAEEYTVEIFEDPHYVLDQYIVESDRVPDEVIEILQEFFEIPENREELEGAGRSSGDA